MPYSHKKTGKDEVTVTKKDSGAVVGHTTPGKLNAYLAALHIHGGDNAAEGGIAEHMEPDKNEPGMKDATVTDFLLPLMAGRAMPEMGMAGKAAPMAEDAFGTQMRDALMKSMSQPAGKYAKGGVVTPYPNIAQMREEEGTEGSSDEANDEEYDPMPHLAEGDIVGDFDVNTGDSDTVKGLPINPQAIPPQAPPVAPAMPAAPPAAAAVPPVPAGKPMPGMPPGITPDMLQQYLGSQRQALSKYSPDAQFAQEQAMLKGRTGIGGRLANAGATLADAIMQGVAGKGNPGFAQQLNERQTELANQSVGAMERARKGTMEQMEAGQKIDMQDPSSPLSEAYQKAFGPIFAKMGYDPKSVGNMPASQINTVADLGVRYADAQTQLELKKAMLQVQTLTAQANIANQKAERTQSAAKELGGRGLFKTIAGMVPGTIANESKNALESELKGGTTGQATGPYGAEVARGGKTYEWSSATGKYHLKQ